MSWLKLYNDIIHDPKIRALAFEDRWHFVALLVLTNDGTLDEPEEVRNTLIEVALGLHGVDLANTKKRLMKLRLICDDWRPVAWEMRQSAKDKTAAERQKRYRENQRLRKGDRDVTRDVTDELRVEGRRKKKELTPSLFACFWDRYPKKVDKQKSAAKFSRLNPEEQQRAIDDVTARAKADDQWVRGYAPNPLTYLNGSRWEDVWQKSKSANQSMGEFDYV